MTSAKSLNHKSTVASYDLKRSSIRNTPVSVLMLVVGFLLFIPPIRDNFVRGTDDYMALGGVFGARAFMYSIIFSVIGMLAALYSFSFLLSKRQTNVYLSMGITRKQLFKNRVCVFVVESAVSILIFMAIVLALNVNLFGFSRITVQHCVFEAASLYASALVGFGVGLLAVFLAGNIIEFAVFAGTFFALPTMFFHSISIILSNVLGTYCIGRIGPCPDFAEDADVLTKFSFLNPLLISTKAGANYNNSNIFAQSTFVESEKLKYFDFSYIAPTLIWLALSVVIIIASYRLFAKRNAEIAGKYGMNNRLGLFCSICVSAFVGIVSIDFTLRWGRWALVIAVALFIGLSIVLSSLLTLNNKKINKNARLILPLGAVMCATLFAISFDVTGYKKRIPAAADLECAYISVEADDYLTSANHYRTAVSTNGIQYKNHSYNSIGPLKKEADLKMFTDIVNGIANCDGDKRRCNVYVRFETKDGKTIFRNYNYATEEALFNILSLYDSEWRDDLIDYAFSEDGHNAELDAEYGNYWQKWYFDDGAVRLADPISGEWTVIGTLDNELREALKTDLKAQTAEQLLTPSEAPITVLCYPRADFECGNTYDRIYVYSYMKNTLSYLEKHGHLDKLQFLRKEIAKADVVAVKDYDAAQPDFDIERNMRSTQFVARSEYYDEDEFISFGGNMTGITDEKILSELEENGVTTYYITNEEGYYVRLWLKYGPMVYTYLPKDKLPYELK